MKVVGLYGTHCTGKSTILNGVAGFGLPISDSQLSRSAQKILGWQSLSRAQESEENMWQLQYAIIEALYDRDIAINKSGEFTLVERTPADLWAYTEMWCKRLNIDHTTYPKAQAYKQKCRALSQNYAMFVQVPIIPQVKFVPDPNRADAQSRVDAEEAMEEFVLSGGLPHYRIQEIDPDCRISETVTIMENLENDKTS